MGKPYTMREMKQIVDFLVEHRHYGEIKGRKMWMDLANTHRIDRTWQSLKETFLKRILPDIHNPYYKLSVEEIASFRGGTDVTRKYYDKLEIHTVTDSSNSTGKQHMRDNQQPSTSKAIPENKTSGEDIQCEKISSRNRSSTDTLVLETCGVEADEEAQETDIKSCKSLRDLITYSDPLTPMLQEVLHDFDSDEDPPMQIVEDDENVPEKPRSPSPFEVRQSRSMKNDVKKSPTKLSADNKCSDGNQSPRSPPGKIKSLKLKKTHKGTWENKGEEKTAKGQKCDVQTMEHVVPKIMTTSRNESTIEKSKPSINCSNTSTDTPIPNNQEALSKPEKSANQDDKVAAANGVLKRSISPQNVPKRKRSKGNSVDTSTSSDVKIIKDTEGTVISINDTSSQHDSSKENISNLENKKQIDQSDKNKKSENDSKDISKVTSEENKQTNSNKKAGLSEKLNMCSDTPVDKNPCLKSVSLFDEQFSTVKYSGSESDDDAIKSKAKNVAVNLKKHDATIEHEENQTKPKSNNETTNNPTPEKGILKKNEEGQKVISISESQNNNHSDVVPTEQPANQIATVIGFSNSTDSDFEKPKQKTVPEGRIFQKSQRDKALANVFGFTNGGFRKRVKHHRTGKHNGGRRYSRTMEESSSSSQSSMNDSDDSEYSHHRHRHRKYLKPKPYRILSQMDGTLFAVEGNRVYPIVRQDKRRMNFAQLLDTEEEHADLYWKKKYEEEKIRADELSRLLELQKTPAISPILQSKTILNPTIEQDEQKPTKGTAKDRTVSISDASDTKAEQRQNNAVKIRFNRDNEIELECQFPHVDPLLEKMAKMFHVADRKEPAAATEKVIVIESGSGTSTPLAALAPRDPEVSEKIKKKESEIFRQIEVLHNMEQNEAARAGTPADDNVTKRKRGRPRKFSTLSISSPNKKVPVAKARAASVDKIHEKIMKVANSKSPVKSDSASNTSNAKRRSARMAKEDATVENQTKATNGSISSKSSKTTKVDIPVDDSQVRYKFPDEPRATSRAKVANKRNSDYISTYANGDYKIRSSPVTCNANSLESSFGYQDSDVSLESTALRRKRRYSSGHFYRKYRIKVRRRSLPYLADDDTCGTIPSISCTTENATLNTEVYRSESYRLLDVKTQNDFVSNNEITYQNKVTTYDNKSHVQISTGNKDNVSATLRADRSHSSRIEEGNSSNISLPLSPELSVVENISVTKEVLERVGDEQPTLNETFGNNEVEQNSDCNKYMMSEIDISLPLMAQDCELQKERQSLIDQLDPETDMISESLLGKICTVHLKEQSSSDSLAIKLGNLLLKSAQKIAQKIQVDDDDPDKENAMEVDTTVKKVKKTRASKKRCSTPQKRVSKNTRASVGPILEEHLVACSYSGRKSCPPAIKIFPCDNEGHVDEQDDTVMDAVNTNPRGRKKKDIIKVKITRPKKKNKSSLPKNDNIVSEKETLYSSRKSICTDSGINDESYFAHCGDEDSIELIHNHSETCLQTNECLGDSIEFIKNRSKSIITVDSDSKTCEDDWDSIKEKELPELFCDNAQDVGQLNVQHELKGASSNGSTVYFTPPSQDSPNSLLTEDLSDEIVPECRSVCPGKWYICSDQETTGFPAEESPAAGIGANLKQIFTMVCAVPNLSTITETSRENDSRKPAMETDDQVIHNSQSI